MPSNITYLRWLEEWESSRDERTRERIQKTGEVFTPSELVNEMLDQLPTELFTNPDKTILDNSCGNGQFLSAALYRRLKNGMVLEAALSTIYGVDIMLDNVEECQNRLLCGEEKLRHIVERNIVCANALTYDYSFE